MSEGQPVMLRVYAHRFREKRLVGFFDMPADKPREAEFTTRMENGELLQVVPYGTGYDKNGKGIWNISGPLYEGVGASKHDNTYLTSDSNSFVCSTRVGTSIFFFSPLWISIPILLANSTTSMFF